MEYRTLWDGVSVGVTLHLHPRESPDKKVGLRRIEWVIFGLKTRETWGLRGDFAFYGIWNLSMTDGWHEHRNVDGGFGIHIRFLVFDLNRQCAAFLVTRKRA
jgi:hypothetical protein